jgi:hypothetical protein
MSSLKYRLDAVWNSRKVAWPSHLVAWSEQPRGYEWIDYQGDGIGLFYTKGKLLHAIRPAGRSKGYSFLSKYYRVALAARDSQIKQRELIDDNR